MTLGLDALLTGAATAAISWTFATIQYRRSHRDQVREALLRQRSEAYRAYIKAVHDTAHHIGRTAPDCPEPLTADAEIYAAVDREVARDLYELSLFADQRVVDAATQLRQALREFRETVTNGAQYNDAAYKNALRPYQAARKAYLDAARTELLDSKQGRVVRLLSLTKEKAWAILLPRPTEGAPGDALA